MIEIETKDAQEKLKKVSESLTRSKIQTAYARALNKGAAAANTSAKRQVRAFYNIKSYNMDKVTQVRKASTTTNVGVMKSLVLAQYGTLSLSAFNPTAVQIMGASKIRGVFQRQGGKKGGITGSYATKVGQKQGIYIEIIKGQKQFIPSAFMGFWSKQGSASGGAIFARGKYGSGGFEFAKGRAPITKLKSKSPYWAILNNSNQPTIAARAMDVYEAELMRQLQGAVEYQGPVAT
jgi:hypothetical protein